MNLPKVTFDPVITGYKVQYREDGSAALMDELPENGWTLLCCRNQVGD